MTNVPIVGDVVKALPLGIGPALAGGGGGNTPQTPAPVSPPTKSAEGVQDAAKRARVAASKARGRGSTILTSELGVSDPSRLRRRTLG